MFRKIFLFLILLLIIMGVLFVKKNKTIINNDDKTLSQIETPDTSTEFTKDEVALHANAQSCWSIIDRKVYDLTVFIDVHPGGSKKILDMCGKNATKDFTKKHGDDIKVLNALIPLEVGTVK